MNKEAFLKALQKQLHGLRKADRRQYIDYYAEMIEDRMEDGIPEDTAVAALGSTQEIAAQILADAPPSAHARKFQVWEIVLLALGSPIWLSLGLAMVMVLLALLAVVASAYVVMWAAVVTLYAADVCLLAGLIAGIAAGCHYFFSGMAAPGLLFIGAALVCGGCTVLLFFGCNRLAVWTVRLGKWAALRFAAVFHRKGDKNE